MFPEIRVVFQCFNTDNWTLFDAPLPQSIHVSLAYVSVRYNRHACDTSSGQEPIDSLEYQMRKSDAIIVSSGH